MQWEQLKQRSQEGIFLGVGGTARKLGGLGKGSKEKSSKKLGQT